MKILHIIGSMDPITGGPCQGIRNLNKAIQKLGTISSEVVSLDDPLAPWLNKDSFTIYPLGPGKNAWGYSPKLYPWLIENLSKFDIVISNGLWLYNLYAATKAMKTLTKRQKSGHKSYTKLPLLYIMPHGMLDPYFQKAPERKFKALRNKIYWQLIESNNIKRASGLLFTCEMELLLARETFQGYSPKKEINVGYGIEDVPVFTQEMKLSFLEKCHGLGDAPYFLFISRIHQKKGVDMLLEAYIETFKQYKNKNDLIFPKLVIAGPGIDTAYGEKITQAILQYPEIKPHVFFPGMLTGSAKWGALYCCEVFILPSHQENFGIAIVEALACKKAVLITKQINIWKEIIDEGGGFVSEDTLQGTKELLQNWMDLPLIEKQKKEAQARRCFENKFSIITAASSLIKQLEIS